MSEIRTISDGSFVLGSTSATTFSAGPGIKIDSPSEGVVRIANDETVLWEDDAGAISGTFSESITTFDRLRVCYVWNPFTDNRGKYAEIPAKVGAFSYMDNGCAGGTYNWFAWGSWQINSTGFSLLKCYQSVGNVTSTSEGHAARMYKVIGINRKEV